MFICEFSLPVADCVCSRTCAADRDVYETLNLDWKYVNNGT